MAATTAATSYIATDTATDITATTTPSTTTFDDLVAHRALPRTRPWVHPNFHQCIIVLIQDFVDDYLEKVVPYHEALWSIDYKDKERWSPASRLLEEIQTKFLHMQAEMYTKVIPKLFGCSQKHR